MLRTWPRMPIRVRFNLFLLLRGVFSTATPLLRQFAKSGYIFIFQLPRPMVNSLATVGDHWFLRYLNAVSMLPDPPKPLEGSHGAELLASSIGPSMEESVASGKGDLAYPASARARAQKGAGSRKSVSTVTASLSLPGRSLWKYYGILINSNHAKSVEDLPVRSRSSIQVLRVH